MKVVIYVSGILGVILLTLGIVGSLAESSGSQLMMFAGIALIIVLCIPLLLFSRYLQEKKIQEIIHNAKFKVSPEIEKNKKKSPTKGWGINNSPFRERKSGLNWGGGNIHGAKASRGSRRAFRKG